MTPTIETIECAVSELQQEQSLLFLNHVLAVRRGLARDPSLEAELAQISLNRPLAYVIHFLAKQILLRASVVGRFGLDWPRFVDLMTAVTELKDPFEDEPNKKEADPTGMFERLTAQQLPSQDRKMVQKYGLALGLFRDVGIASGVDLPKEIEAELGMPVEQFLALGFVCGALQLAPLGVGTFTPECLAEAFALGVGVCKPELWRPFLDRTSCTPGLFRERQAVYATTAYPQFEFNVLRRYPIIRVERNRHLAVDPELLVERCTLGLFYDLFERDLTAFSRRFGFPFEKFVGMLLRSVCSSEMWSHSEWQEAHPAERSRKGHKVGDWAYVDDSDTILFECKSLRPSLNLVSIGDDESVQKMTDRVVKALQQLIEFNEAIKAGGWTEAGIPQRDATAFVLVMYGQVYTVNASIWKSHILARIEELGLSCRPFVVLSLSELDSVVRLIELGFSLSEVITRICGRDKSLREYPELRENAISSVTTARGREFLDRIRVDK